jgi:L-rhamnose-H+ transport protein
MEVSMKEYGNEAWQANFVVAALVLWGGALSACGACAFKLTKNKTWGSLTAPGMGRVLLVAFIMALLHDGAVLFYGVGASNLGALGAAVGYAIFMSFAIIVGNINGFLTKEWKGASTRSIAFLAVGILVLVIGVSTLARGNYMQGQAATKAAAETAKDAVTKTKKDPGVKAEAGTPAEKK